MRAMSPKVENRTVGVFRSAIQIPRQVDVPVPVGAVRRLIPERWAVDLLLVALAALIVVATAIVGLGIVSTSVPAPDPLPGHLRMCGYHTARPIAFDVCGDPACCGEVR
jgi:hypothetical protein